MRVALVIERFEPAGGGMEAVAWRVAHGLAAAGDEVHVVAREANASSAVQLRRVPVRRGWQPLRVLAFTREAARAAPRGSFDVVHAFSRTLEQDLYRAGGGSHADYLRRAHTPWARRLRELSPRHAVQLGIERRIFGDASQHIQCGSKLVRGEIAGRFDVAPERLSVIYNGVDTELFHPPAKRAQQQEGPIWLFAGSGWHRKGLDTALRALAASRESTPLLWVAGRDPTHSWERMALRLGIAEQVSFMGNQQDMPGLYRRADALLLPTRYDAFANVCLEAAASGLPVVTSGANGSAEVLEQGAIVVDDPEDHGAFAEALDRLADPTRRARAGESAREAALERTWAEHISELRALYARIAS